MKVLLQYLLETSLSGPAHSCSRNRCEIPYIVHSPVAGTRGGGVPVLVFFANEA